MTTRRLGEPARWARRAAPLAGLALLAVVVAGCGSGAPAQTGAATTPSAHASGTPGGDQGVTRIELRFAGGSVVGGVSRHDVAVGSPVEVVVTSDVADEVHLHGYDKLVDVPAGGTATLSFVPDVPGVFEVELHGQQTLLAMLEVR